MDGVDDGFAIGGVGYHGDGIVVRALLVMKFQVEGLGGLVVGSHERGDGLGLEGHGSPRYAGGRLQCLIVHGNACEKHTTTARLCK